ncbi:hypothetical protein TRVA0_010S01684 [Trichomonascus vanleenenianus]|uniref:uncharacterized protein n=1 Tax=Trichomonascus vanleenenianus TaxID=2268995 RepID=UPI003ECB1F90
MSASDTSNLVIELGDKDTWDDSILTRRYGEAKAEYLKYHSVANKDGDVQNKPNETAAEAVAAAASTMEAEEAAIQLSNMSRSRDTIPQKRKIDAPDESMIRTPKVLRQSKIIDDEEEDNNSSTLSSPPDVNEAEDDAYFQDMDGPTRIYSSAGFPTLLTGRENEVEEPEKMAEVGDDEIVLMDHEVVEEPPAVKFAKIAGGDTSTPEEEEDEDDIALIDRVERSPRKALSPSEALNGRKLPERESSLSSVSPSKSVQLGSNGPQRKEIGTTGASAGPEKPAAKEEKTEKRAEESESAAAPTVEYPRASGILVSDESSESAGILSAGSDTTVSEVPTLENGHKPAAEKTQDATKITEPTKVDQVAPSSVPAKTFHPPTNEFVDLTAETPEPTPSLPNTSQAAPDVQLAQSIQRTTSQDQLTPQTAPLVETTPASLASRTYPAVIEKAPENLAQAGPVRQERIAQQGKGIQPQPSNNLESQAPVAPPQFAGSTKAQASVENASAKNIITNKELTSEIYRVRALSRNERAENLRRTLKSVYHAFGYRPPQKPEDLVVSLAKASELDVATIETILLFPKFLSVTIGVKGGIVPAIKHMAEHGYGRLLSPPTGGSYIGHTAPSGQTSSNLATLASASIQNQVPRPPSQAVPRVHPQQQQPQPQQQSQSRPQQFNQQQPVQQHQQRPVPQYQQRPAQQHQPPLFDQHQQQRPHQSQQGQPQYRQHHVPKQQPNIQQPQQQQSAWNMPRQAQPQSTWPPSGAAAPNRTLPLVSLDHMDENMRNVAMAMYWAGYYHGVYASDQDRLKFNQSYYQHPDPK